MRAATHAPTTSPAPRSARAPLLYGHRGASAHRPENTLASFDLALKSGATALELDVHASVDGVIVVSHDDTGHRMAGVPRAIRTTPFQEILTWDVGFGFLDGSGRRPFLGAGYRIATLEEVLHAFPHTPLNIDVKARGRGIEARVVELLRKARAEARVLLASFHDDTLARIRSFGFRGPTALGRQEVRRLFFTPLPLLRTSSGRLRGHAAQVPLSYGPLRFATPAFIDKCHRLGIRVDFWTVNDTTTALSLVEMGADGVMTDDPAALAPAFHMLSGALTRRAHSTSRTISESE